MICIYILKCPVSGDVRYVGKTKNPETRLAVHLCKSKNQLDHHCARWIRTLRKQGLKPVFEIIRRVPDGGDWQKAEIDCIAEYRAAGHPLTNMTGGGDGFHDVEPELLKRRGASRSRTLKDPVKRAEFVDRMVSSRNNPETLAAKSAGAIKAWADPKKRQRMLDGARMPEAHKNKSEAITKRNADPEYRAKQSATSKRIWSTPERRAEAKARVLAMHANPEQSARRAASIKAAYQKPEAKARLAAAMALVRARPEVNAKRSATLKAFNARRRAEAAGARL